MPGEREITFKAAVIEALAEEMRADPTVIVIGEDVGAAGGVFGQTQGLAGEFGASRVIDTPISEAAILGTAIGAAMTGLRPVVEIMFGDFVTLVMDQLVNQAAKLRYMSAGALGAPLVLRTAGGVGGNLGPQHSQSFHAWLAHVPGLKLALPATPYDAKGLMKAALRDPDPVIFFENRNSYNLKGPVPAEDYLVPLGQAQIVRPGGAASIISVGAALQTALAAAHTLAGQGIDAEVIDLRSLVPLDEETIIASVKKTSHALILDTGHQRFGVTGELAALIGKLAFDYLDAPVERLGAPDLPIPLSRSLEPLAQPTEAQVVQCVLDLIR